MAVSHTSTVLLPVLPQVFPCNTPTLHSWSCLFSRHPLSISEAGGLYLCQCQNICFVLKSFAGWASGPWVSPHHCSRTVFKFRPLPLVPAGALLQACLCLAMSPAEPLLLLLPGSECAHSGLENKRRPGSFDLFADVKYLQICGTKSHPTLCLHNGPLQLTTLDPVTS